MTALKILVTGGAGFIGSHTVDALLARGHEVRILDVLDPRVHPRGLPPWVPRDADLIIGDAADPADLGGALAGCSAVIHLAAYQDYMPEFSRFVHTNTESTALLFELVVADPRRYPVAKVVLASSQAVAGEGRYRCRAEGTVFRPAQRSLDQLERGEWDIACVECGGAADPLPIDEATCTPHTAYAVSKHAIELLAASLGRRYGVATAALRYTYVQGPRNSFFNAYSGIARRFALQLRANLAPTCYEDGRQLRDFVNVRDVAAANVLALEGSPPGNYVYNVGGGRAVSVLEFARMMIDAYGASVEPHIPGAFRVGDTRHTFSDVTRLGDLGWSPSIPVEQTVAEYVEWLDQYDAPAGAIAEADRAMEAAGVVRRRRQA